MHGMEIDNQSPQTELASPLEQLRIMGTKNKILGPKPAIKQTQELTLNVQNCSPREQNKHRSTSPFEEGFKS